MYVVVDIVFAEVAGDVPVLEGTVNVWRNVGIGECPARTWALAARAGIGDKCLGTAFRNVGGWENAALTLAAWFAVGDTIVGDIAAAMGDTMR